jgi:flagellar protein FliO/FliZ
MSSLDVFASIIKMVAALALVLGLMIAAAYIMKKVMARAGSGAADEGIIKIVSTRYLGPKNSIMLLEVLGRIMVVGVSNHQMSMLATISDPEALEQLREAAGRARRPFPIKDVFKDRTKWAAAVSLSGKGKRENG